MPKPPLVVRCVEAKLAIRQLLRAELPLPEEVRAWVGDPHHAAMPAPAVRVAIDRWVEDSPVAGAHRRYAEALAEVVRTLEEDRPGLLRAIRKLMHAGVETLVGPEEPPVIRECEITGEYVEVHGVFGETLKVHGVFGETLKRIRGNFFSPYMQGVMSPCQTEEQAHAWWQSCGAGAPP